MVPLDAPQRALSNGTQVHRANLPPSPGGTCAPFRTKLRHGGVGSTGKPPARPLQPAPPGSPCIPVPSEGMHRDCTDPLGAGCGRLMDRAPPSYRMQPPGAAGPRASLVAPPAPPSLRKLARCTQWVRGAQVEGIGAPSTASLE